MKFLKKLVHMEEKIYLIIKFRIMVMLKILLQTKL